jgi:catechol-2,3-dioxygenase
MWRASAVRQCGFPPPRVHLYRSTLAHEGNGHAQSNSLSAIDALQPRMVANFWCDVLGWQVVDEDDSIVSIAPGGRSWPTVDVVKVPEKKTVRNRLHLDLRADGVDTPDELERLLAMGARRTDVGQGADATWVVLSDPEGHEFCLLSRTAQEARAANH